ncbi:MAG TPA: TusE/DsrC/DsvC family sulfur relay protein [Gammaproteobacteria bacterium]|nr:TusE/DsrC/DsvC family sulfur relay protein [Gammaproteobacteria bacterium]
MTDKTDVLARTVPQQGFPDEQGVWSEEVARRLAQQDGIGDLGEEHWRVIRTLREHFLQYGAAAPERYACHTADLDEHCIHRLFQSSREAWRVAGLPDPGEEYKTYMD